MERQISNEPMWKRNKTTRTHAERRRRTNEREQNVKMLEKEKRKKKKRRRRREKASTSSSSSLRLTVLCLLYVRVHEHVEKSTDQKQNGQSPSKKTPCRFIFQTFIGLLSLARSIAAIIMSQNCSTSRIFVTTTQFFSRRCMSNGSHTVRP